MKALPTLVATSPVTSAMSTDLNTRVVVRDFQQADIADILPMMRQLAAFEDYLDDFKVTATDIGQRGLGDNPEFGILVAEDTARGNSLLGIAVYYVIPYTFDLHPDVVLKELFVAEHARGLGVGRALMKQLSVLASALGARRVRWLVLTNNHNAKSFYASLGAHCDTKWENWQLTLPKTADSHG